MSKLNEIHVTLPYRMKVIKFARELLISFLCLFDVAQHNFLLLITHTKKRSSRENDPTTLSIRKKNLHF